MFRHGIAYLMALGTTSIVLITSSRADGPIYADPCTEPCPPIVCPAPPPPTCCTAPPPKVIVEMSPPQVEFCEVPAVHVKAPARKMPPPPSASAPSWGYYPAPAAPTFYQAMMPGYTMAPQMSYAPSFAAPMMSAPVMQAAYAAPMMASAPMMAAPMMSAPMMAPPAAAPCGSGGFNAPKANPLAALAAQQAYQAVELQTRAAALQDEYQALQRSMSGMKMAAPLLPNVEETLAGLAPRTKRPANGDAAGAPKAPSAEENTGDMATTVAEMRTQIAQIRERVQGLETLIMYHQRELEKKEILPKLNENQ